MINRQHLACRCCGLNNATDQLVHSLNHLCALLAYEPIITSACRCPSHNKAVGGVHNSRHLYGEAVDMIPANSQIDQLKKAAYKAGFCRVLWFPQRGYAHLDFGRSPPK